MPTNVAAISPLKSEHLVFVTGSPSPDNTTGEPTGESGIDTSAAVALISISKGPEGNTVFNPPTTTIKTGGEILILNNDTVAHTIRNGMGPDDPLSGRLFGVGPLEPKGFIEYVATNLQQGTYPFYSTPDPSIKGELVVTN
jgi:plastocyanin